MIHPLAALMAEAYTIMRLGLGLGGVRTVSQRGRPISPGGATLSAAIARRISGDAGRETCRLEMSRCGLRQGMAAEAGRAAGVRRLVGRSGLRDLSGAGRTPHRNAGRTLDR